MSLIKDSENLKYVFEKIKDMQFDGGVRQQPVKENVAELMILHDLEELVRPAKEKNSFNQELLQKLLKNEINTSPSGVVEFYNFAVVLKNPTFLEHFKAMLSE